MKHISILWVLILPLFISSPAKASFFAACHFKVDVYLAHPEITQVANAAYTREVWGKVIEARNNGTSHIDCVDMYKGKSIEFHLQVKKSDPLLKALGSVKVGSVVEVDFNSFHGLSPWGKILGTDYVYVNIPSLTD